jgi:uncharacterized membrane protein YphA (DoxX/SURF4 family)
MNVTRYLPFVGRLFIGLPFLVSGLSKLAAYDATIALIQSSTLPLPPPLAYAEDPGGHRQCQLAVVPLECRRATGAVVFERRNEMASMRGVTVRTRSFLEAAGEPK